jgi:hypothetical protein
MYPYPKEYDEFKQKRYPKKNKSYLKKSANLDRKER